jgi:hypothetical protein
LIQHRRFVGVRAGEALDNLDQVGRARHRLAGIASAAQENAARPHIP